jgi:hypothetical protein
MSRTIKLILCISLIFIFLISFNIVNATEENSSEASEVTQEEPESVITENASDISNLSVLKPTNNSKVSSINSYEQANLKLNNVLCIILIAIGTILILLALAILIRAK